MKFYENTRPDGRKIWWTQRNKRGDYFEIERRGLFTFVFIARVNGMQYGVFDTFSEAEQYLKGYERRTA